ncbi:MAG: ROK family protein [Blastocatellia bacterium]
MSKTTGTRKSTKARRRAAANKEPGAAQNHLRTLAIDIGGTGLKASVLDSKGEMTTERVRIKTPENCPPKMMITLLARLVKSLPEYDRVSVGFPGVVRKGRIVTAHNLGTKAWRGFNLDEALTKRLGRPVRVLNDADIQGLGAIRGEGVEMVITLGTGLGSSLFEDGRIAPHLEFAHHPFRKGETYEQQLGNAALQAIGKRRWNRRVQRAIETLRALTNFDHLYIGGGNAAEIKLKLPPDVSLVPNELGMKGGVWLWEEKCPGHAELFSRIDEG